MSNHNKTPILQTFRKKGGTMYVFPSASEDIGLNLNSRSHSVSLSHYALLNIPNASTLENLDSVKENLFNVTFIPGHYDQLNDSNSIIGSDSNTNTASWQIAASLQNYAMNFETRLVNESDYNYQDLDTVSERVFWKWLKETGAIQWKPIETSTGFLSSSKADSSYFFTEGDEETSNYNDVVKCFGTIDGGNNKSNSFGFFNETYINVPSSYGAGKVFFTQVDSNNYKLGRTYTIDNQDYLEGRNDNDNDSLIYTINKPFTDTLGSDGGTLSNESQNTYMTVDGKQSTWYGGQSNTAQKAYYTQKAFDPTSSDKASSTISYYKGGEKELTFRRSNLDGVEIVKDISEINYIWKNADYLDDYSKSVLNITSFDDVNADPKQILHPEERFNFNAILLYYSLYNQDDPTQKELATNLYGIIFLNAPVSNVNQTGFSLDFNIPGYEKEKSTDDSFGTGFSFRVNVKTMSVYDNSDAIINDNTTADSLYSQDFNDVISQLNTAIDTLRVNVENTRIIKNDYASILSQFSTNGLKIEDLSTRLNSYIHGNRSNVLNTSVMNSPIYRSGSSLDCSVISVEIPVEYDSESNETNYSTVATIDSSGMKLSSLDSSVIKYKDAYTRVVKYEKDSRLSDASVDTSDLSDVQNLLSSMFDSPNGSLNIVYTDYNRDYLRYNQDSSQYLPPLQRTKELVIDPDSEALNNGNLDHLIIDHKEGLSDDNGNYEEAYIDNAKLVPYIVSYLQNFQSTLDEKISSNPQFDALTSQINDVDNKIETFSKNDFLTSYFSSYDTGINSIIYEVTSYTGNKSIMNYVTIPTVTLDDDGLMSKDDKLTLETLKTQFEDLQTKYDSLLEELNTLKNSMTTQNSAKAKRTKSK